MLGGSAVLRVHSTDSTDCSLLHPRARLDRQSPARAASSSPAGQAERALPREGKGLCLFLVMCMQHIGETLALSRVNDEWANPMQAGI